MPKGFALALVFALFFVPKAESAMVSFLIIETGLAEEGRNIHSEIWESALMDTFFDTGHIVCNAPMLRLKTKGGDIQKLAEKDMKEALEGGALFLIVAKLDYEPENDFPAAITLEMYKTKEKQRIYEKSLTGKTYKTNKEEFEDIKGIAKGLVPLVK